MGLSWRKVSAWTAAWTASVTLALVPSRSADACTTFLLPSSRTLAKSYDWHLDHGLLVVNKRGVTKSGFVLRPTDRPPTWTSRYGSVTLNQYGREFPNSGMNEAGLAVEVMVLDESDFPPASATPSLNETQWVQYQLDNFATVDEVVAAARSVRIANAVAPLHYLVCDRSGVCATLEYVAGILVVHDDETGAVPVLANDTYASSRAHLARYAGFGGSQAVPTGGMGSLTRFVRAADHVRRAPAGGDAVRYAFDGIAKVAGEATQWRVVYELANERIHFASRSAPTIKSVRTGDLDYGCESPVLSLSVATAQAGDATARLATYDASENRRVIVRSLSGMLPPAVIDRAVAFPDTTRCTAP